MDMQKGQFEKLILFQKNSKFAKEIMGKEVAHTIISYSFWNNVFYTLKIGGPLIKLLRLVDGEQKPPMGYLYKATDKANRLFKYHFLTSKNM